MASRKRRTVEVAFEYPKRSSRLLNGLFLKWLLVIPHLVVIAVYGTFVAITMLFAWAAILLTGRYPRRLWEMNATYVRYTTSVNAYLVMITDQYPQVPADPLHAAGRSRRGRR